MTTKSQTDNTELDKILKECSHCKGNTFYETSKGEAWACEKCEGKGSFVDRLELIKILAEQDIKSRIDELEKLLPQMNIEEYSLWVRAQIVNSLKELRSKA